MKKIKATIEELGLNYKKEMLMLILIVVAILSVGVLAMLLLDSFIYPIIATGAALFAGYMWISRYNTMKVKLEQEHEDELIGLVNYLEILLSNHVNVYNSFQQICKYCSPWMKFQIELLLKGIDEDKTVQPFIDFSENFKNNHIENLMISIYQMIDGGENKESLLQFDLLFDSLSKSHQDTIIARKQRKLESLNTYPLIGSGFIVVILVAGIMFIIEDLISVI